MSNNDESHKLSEISIQYHIIIVNEQGRKTTIVTNTNMKTYKICGIADDWLTQ